MNIIMRMTIPKHELLGATFATSALFPGGLVCAGGAVFVAEGGAVIVTCETVLEVVGVMMPVNVLWLNKLVLDPVLEPGKDNVDRVRLGFWPSKVCVGSFIPLSEHSTTRPKMC